MNIIKPIGEEISVTTPNTVENARLIRIYASSTSKVTITDPENNALVGSFTVPADSITIIEKNKTDTIEGTTALLCTPISYTS